MTRQCARRNPVDAVPDEQGDLGAAPVVRHPHHKYTTGERYHTWAQEASVAGNDDALLFSGDLPQCAVRLAAVLGLRNNEYVIPLVAKPKPKSLGHPLVHQPSHWGATMTASSATACAAYLRAARTCSSVK